EAGLYSLLIVGILVFLGASLFIRINNKTIARLKNSEAYNRMLFDTSPVGLALCKMDGTLVDVNRSYSDILGRGIQETKELSYWEITPEEYAPQEQKQLDLLDKTNHYGPYEKEYIHKDGSRVPVSLIGQIVERDGEKYIWSAVEDITYRREAEKKINKLNAELEERVKIRTRELEQTLKELKETQSYLIHSEKMASLGQLTAGIGHEINNPVNFINAGIHSLESNLAEIMEVISKYDTLDHSNIQASIEDIEALKKDIGFHQLVEFVNKNIGNIKNGVSRTVEIIDALKTYSREDKETFSVIEIHENIEATLVMLHSKYVGKIQIEKKYGILPEVECLPGGINQILTNIISNSIDAIVEHKTNEEGRIIISTFREKDSAVIEIEDNGIGIPDDKIDAIFDPFYTTKEVGKGTGLGLSICYNIIQRHRGELKVKSTPGKGTVFKMVLPLKQKM
ncbi:MAG: ATP-binding protein, partial [Cyclobacteriaceae bacterium]|nr:ATP-binding protein [Cyclobacteriaceae bacterium]